VNVYIARDGAEIGECQLADLAELVREGQLQSTDLYWHEGMETWLPVADAVTQAATKTESPPDSPAPIAVERPRPPETLATTQRISMEDEPLNVAPAESIPAELLEKPEPFRGGERRNAWSGLQVPNLLRSRLIAGAVALVLVVGAYAFISARRQRAARPATIFTRTTPKPLPSADDVREAAAADLRERIKRLPGKPEPPLHTFYYNVSVNMRKMLTARAPWIAIIRGGENTIDPATESTTLHTDFVLTVEYRDGAWTFQQYRASTSDMLKQQTTEVVMDATAPTPPSIVGMLGLKMPPAP
jgi:hypothetical protein